MTTIFVIFLGVFAVAIFGAGIAVCCCRETAEPNRQQLGDYAKMTDLEMVAT